MLTIRMLSQIFIGILVGDSAETSEEAIELNAALSEYAESVYNRLRTTPDALTRVLPINDANVLDKYHTFFLKLKTSVERVWPTLDQMLPGQFLSIAQANIVLANIDRSFLTLLARKSRQQK
jgi:hypothetical protein